MSLFTYVNNADIETFLDNQEDYENKIAFLGNSGNIAAKGNIYGMNEDLSYLTNSEVASIFVDGGNGSNSRGGIIGGGTSDYMPILGKILRYTESFEKGHLYIGIPHGTDLTNIDIKFYRYCRVKNRIGTELGVLNNRTFQSEIKRYKGLHEIWQAGGNHSKYPLIKPKFVNSQNYDFSENNYDYYEVTGDMNLLNNTFEEYINNLTTTNRGQTTKDGTLYNVTAGQMLSRKNNYLCLIKNNKIISNLIRICTIKNTNNNRWVLKL